MLRLVIMHLTPDSRARRKLRQPSRFILSSRGRETKIITVYRPKGILDGLVEMGVLYADSSSFVTFGGVILEVDYERPRCEVKIEMLEEDIDFKKWDKYDKTDPNGDEAIKMLDGLGDN